MAGQRTPFADYNTVLRDVSPTDLGIAAARALFATSGIPASAVDAIVAGNMAQASFDAYYLPRHIGLYSGVNPNVPALLVQRLCCTGFETLLTAADHITLGKASVVLCVGAESMSRNPVAAYTQRSGRAVSAKELTFWEVYGNLRWAAGAILQGQRVLSGAERDLELLAIPWRAAEMEYEALRLIAHHAQTSPSAP